MATSLRYFGTIPDQLTSLAPAWALGIVGVVLFLVPILRWVTSLLREAKELWSTIYSPARRRQAQARRAAAAFIWEDLLRINTKDERWNDEEYAELEAEIEAEGRRRSSWLLWRRSSLRREQSLSKALRSSSETRILLQGEPGSGKSVALRHVAILQAKAGVRRIGPARVLPLYVNLRKLQREPSERINSALIRRTVLASVNRRNHEDLAQFFANTFDEDIAAGRLLFLFDSFDEIPDVLEATDGDGVVRDYSEAIEDFLSPFNRCRAVIASREFRGPEALSWPRFRVLSLSDQRRRELVAKAVADPTVVSRIMGSFLGASAEMERISRNPLFLALLCEHVRRDGDLPDNLHAVLQSYVNRRLLTDGRRIYDRFRLLTPDIRAAAEEIAAAMLLEGVGLEVERAVVARLLSERSGGELVATAIDALAMTGLARIDVGGPVETFSFVHRRFQEYFATCCVMRRPAIVSVESLLTDGRWRETAVVLLQTQTASALAPVLRGIDAFVHRTFEFDLEVAANPEEPFAWPAQSLHLIAILQDGLQGRTSLLPWSTRRVFGALLTAALASGSILDRKWAIEVCGVAPEHVLIAALRHGFASRSRILADAAHRQASRLRRLTADIERAIRDRMLQLMARRLLLRERDATVAFIGRLPDHERLMRVLKLLFVLPVIDVVVHVAAVGFIVTLDVLPSINVPAVFTLGCLLALVASRVGFRAAVAPSTTNLRDELFSMVGILGRVVACFGMGIVIIRLNTVTPIALTASVILVGLIWPILATRSIPSRALVRPIGWVLAPLWAVTRVASDMWLDVSKAWINLFRPPVLWVSSGTSPRTRARRWWRLFWKRTSPDLARLMTMAWWLLCMPSLLSLALIVGRTVQPAPTEAPPKPPPDWEALGIILGIPLASVIAVQMFDGIRVWLLLRRPPPRSVADLVEQIEAVVLYRNRVRLVERCRDRRSLREGPQTSREILALCREVERIVTLGVSSGSTLFSANRLQRRLNAFIPAANAALLDEVALLAESLGVRRQQSVLEE